MTEDHAAERHDAFVNACKKVREILSYEDPHSGAVSAALEVLNEVLD